MSSDISIRPAAAEETGGGPIDESKPAAPSAAPAPEPQKPAGDDKFLNFSKKAAAGAGKALGTGYEKFKHVIADGNFEPRKSIKVIDGIIDWARTKCLPESFESLSDWFAKYGHGGLVVAQVLTVIYAITTAIALRSWSMLLIGFGFAALMVITQYTADKFLNAGDSLIKSSPSKLSSEAFLNCLALAATALGITFLIIFTSHKQFNTFLVGTGLLGVCISIAYIALNPSLANIVISKEVAAGEEAIGILSFVVKAVVRIVPFAFGIGSIIGPFAILVSTIAIMRHGEEAFGAANISSIYFVIACACLPLASYIFFTVYHLIIDVLRAILVIPGKLDELNSDR